MPSGTSFYALRGDHVRRYLWASEFVKDRCVIDVGCGHGYGTDFLSGVTKFILGIDNDLDAIAFAQAHYSRPNLSFKPWNVESDQIDGSFDVAISFEVLEHLHHPERYLSNVKNCLGSSGIFFLSTPNRLYSERSYIDGKSQYPYHVKEYCPQDCFDLLSRYFRVESIFVEYARSGRDERLAQASRAPEIVRKWVPLRVKRWYVENFVVSPTEGAYEDYVIKEVESFKEIDRTRPTQLYRLSPLS